MATATPACSTLSRTSGTGDSRPRPSSSRASRARFFAELTRYPGTPARGYPLAERVGHWTRAVPVMASAPAQRPRERLGLDLLLALAGESVLLVELCLAARQLALVRLFDCAQPGVLGGAAFVFAAMLGGLSRAGDPLALLALGLCRALLELGHAP